ncbi:MAG: purine biosynthesis protein PurH [Bilifractor sp.]|jgi:hypothetical protein
MRSLLIRDTTQEEREQIVRDSLGVTEGLCDGCASGIIDMYDDYIYGKRELKEINASFSVHYVHNDPDEEPKRSCIQECE